LTYSGTEGVQLMVKKLHEVSALFWSILHIQHLLHSGLLHTITSYWSKWKTTNTMAVKVNVSFLNNSN